MNLTPVTSSNVEAVGYEPTTKVLTVKFKNGRTYEYTGVPLDAANGLLAAESVGKYLNAEIKPNYPATQVS